MKKFRLLFDSTIKTFKLLFDSTIKAFKPFSGPLRAIFALLVLDRIFMVIIPYLQGRMIDNLSSHGPLKSSVVFLSLILGIYIIGSLFAYLREKMEIERFDYDVRQEVGSSTLKKLLQFSIGQHTNANSGLRRSVSASGESAIKDVGHMMLYSIIPMLVQIVLVTTAVMLTNVWLGLLVLCSSAYYIAVTVIHNMSFYGTLRLMKKKWSVQSKEVNEFTRNIGFIKTNAEEDFAVSECRRTFEEVSEPAKKDWSGFLRIFYVQQSGMYVFQVGTVLLGVVFVQAGVETAGTLVMVIGWIGSIFGVMMNLGWTQRQLLQDLASIELYEKMLKIPVAVLASLNPVVRERFEGRIEFKGVSFQYPKVVVESDDPDGDEEETKDDEEEVEKHTLEDVSFVIEPGETVAIVGHSGAGKTTLLQLLLRGYDPDKGSVLIDGVDLRELDQRAYLKRVGYVEQRVPLFDKSLRYNLVIGLEDKASVTDERLDEVARKSRIDQFYDRLGAKKFETEIGEDGVRLSGGERQRVGIARALIKNPDILIFDEATSSLDAVNEKLIHEAIDEALEGRTGIIIAHRLSTIKDADKIIVLEKGKVVGIGKHDELMTSCPEYNDLVKHQIV